MRITRKELQNLIESCLYEMVGEFDDNAGVHHEYDSKESSAIVNRMANEDGDLTDLKKTISRILNTGRWDFTDIIRTEGGKTTFYAMPQEGKRPVEFGMVAARLGDILDKKVEHGAYNPKNESETEGIHFIKISHKI